MGQNDNVKTAAAIPPQSEMTSNFSSPVERYLGLIKASAIIMAVLIVVALVVIVVTIYSRFNTANVAKFAQQDELVIPAESMVTSASFGDEGQMLLVIEGKAGQQLWQIDTLGKIIRKTRIVQVP